MARRLGLVYPNTVTQETINPQMDKADDKVTTSLEGVYRQSQLLNNMGGHLQQERMIYDKKRTLDRALLYSYQGADIKDVNAEDGSMPARALINPNRVKQDYDDKVVSVAYEHDFTPGHIFKWLGTNTYWLIYLQDLTELAYFRGDIRRCSYLIKWADEDKNIHSTYAAVRGPVETKIISNSQSGISLDAPNYSLNILIPKTEQTQKSFKRYFKFYVQDIENGSIPVCWRVETTDSISMPGIISLNAVEYYANLDTDMIGEIADYKDEIEASVFEGEEEVNPEISIIGESFIKPKMTYTYSCETGGEWFIDTDKKYPILILSKTDNEIKIKWDKFYSGQFKLHCGDIEKTIVVETLY